VKAEADTACKHCNHKQTGEASAHTFVHSNLDRSHLLRSLLARRALAQFVAQLDGENASRMRGGSSHRYLHTLPTSAV
jgi:hypothetical protein